MNLKTRRLLRNLVRQNPDLTTTDPHQLLQIAHGKQPQIEEVEQVVEQEVKAVETQQQLDLNSLDWNSMLELAKTNNITNYRKMKKSDLISSLLELQNDGRLLQTN